MTAISRDEKLRSPKFGCVASLGSTGFWDRHARPTLVAQSHYREKLVGSTASLSRRLARPARHPWTAATQPAAQGPEISLKTKLLPSIARPHSVIPSVPSSATFELSVATKRNKSKPTLRIDCIATRSPFAFPTAIRRISTPDNRRKKKKDFCSKPTGVHPSLQPQQKINSAFHSATPGPVESSTSACDASIERIASPPWPSTSTGRL